MNAVRIPQLSSSAGAPLDWAILGSTLFLLLLGFVMVGSASSEISARSFGHPFHLLARHGVFLALALCALVFALATPIRVWQKLHIIAYLLALLVLILVLIPGVGREVNGATRWIPLGFFTLQGSEFVKVFVAMFIAGYVARPSGLDPTTLQGYLLPIGLTMLLSTLLLAQPDFGAVIVMMSGVFAVLFLIKTPMKYFLPTLLIGAGLVALLVFLQPYRLARLTAFTDPWAHQFGGGYQLTQALIAIGRGEWFGLGLGNSVQKLFYLPEAHTDFLFSILVEELGIAGALVTLIAFAILICRGLIISKIALRLDFVFHGALSAAVSVMLGVQALINLGVNLGVLPTKGLTLPLMSFGGNSLLVTGLMIGLLLRIEWEIRHAPPPPNRKGRAHHG